jgi:transposase
MAYSIDFRKRAVAYKQEGHTFKQLREAFGIPSETYYNWKEKLHSGYYQMKAKQIRRRKIDKEA